LTADRIYQASAALRRYRIGLLVLCFVFGAVIGLGSVRRPYGPVESHGPVLPPAGAPASAKTLKIATFNIHSGRGVKGDRNLARTADVLRGIDVAGLNEVRGPSVFGSADQAAELGARLGAAAVFGPSERRWYVTSFGNGLLSRFPILSWRSRPLEAGRLGSYRAVFLAEIAAGAAKLRVLIAHPERGELRHDQLREIKTIFARVGAPAVLLGDLNASSDHPALREIEMLPGTLHVLSGKDSSPRGIDHIYAKGLTVRNAGVTVTPASDHPLVWAEVALPGTGEMSE
jgi:endonuclease/exonuclease/phosphatase family metal-dependent hydrolase